MIKKLTFMLCLLIPTAIFAKDISSIQSEMTEAAVTSMQEQNKQSFKIKKRDFEKELKDVKVLKWYTDLAVIDALKDESIYYNESINISAEAQRNGDVLLTFMPTANQLTEKDYKQLRKDIKDVIKKEGVEKSASDLDKVKWAYEYVINNCSYKEYDTSKEQLNNPYRAFYDKDTQCYGYTLLVKEFLDQLGIENEIMAGKYAKKGFETYYLEAAGRYAYEMHAWNLVKVDNKWYHLDATFGDNKKLGNKEQFFLFGNTTAKETRTWSAVDKVINSKNYYSDDQLKQIKDSKYQDLYEQIK